MTLYLLKWIEKWLGDSANEELLGIFSSAELREKAWQEYKVKTNINGSLCFEEFEDDIYCSYLESSEIELDVSLMTEDQLKYHGNDL